MLEIGVGNGTYTELFKRNGVTKLVGIDVTSEFFPELRKVFPDYTFIKGDITEIVLNEKFDVIMFIDVIEHIVKRNKLENAMDTIYKSLNKGGMFFLSGFHSINKTNQEFFYEMRWSENDILDMTRKFKILFPITQFRGDCIVVFQKR